MKRILFVISLLTLVITETFAQIWRKLEEVDGDFSFGDTRYWI